MPDYRPSSVTSMVTPKYRSDKTGGTLHSSWIRNLATFGYLHPYLFLYLNTLIIVPVKQWNEVKNCIWSWNVHGVLRANCLWWQRDRAHLFGLYWLAVTPSELVYELSPGEVKVPARALFYSLAGGWPCSAKAWVANNLTGSSILNCCY